MKHKDIAHTEVSYRGQEGRELLAGIDDFEAWEGYEFWSSQLEAQMEPFDDEEFKEFEERLRPGAIKIDRPERGANVHPF